MQPHIADGDEAIARARVKQEEALAVFKMSEENILVSIKDDLACLDVMAMIVYQMMTNYIMNS